LKIGDTSREADKKRHKESKNRMNAIAEISSVTNPQIKYYAAPTSKHSNDVTVTIGRSKDCDVIIDNKKISSVHCKLVFTRSEGESVAWNLVVESMSLKNKTYIGSELIETEKRLTQWSDQIKLCLVFPIDEKPVETLVITPILENDNNSSDEATNREEKRQKKEVREFEKKSQKWEKEYNEQVRQLIEHENRLLHEINHLDTVIAAKKLSVTAERSEVERKEQEMKMKGDEYNNAMIELQSQHAKKLHALTESLEAIVTKLAHLTDEKLKLQLDIQ
jgi:hypothetical protein